MPHASLRASRPFIIGAMVDVGAQVRAEQAIRHASRHKDEFLALLGHELRTLLAPIQKAAEVLRRVGDGDERLTWVRGVLVRQLGHITRPVDDLPDISRIARGTLHLRLESVDLTQVVRRAVDDTRPLFEHKSHGLRITLPDEPRALSQAGVQIDGGDEHERLRRRQRSRTRLPRKIRASLRQARRAERTRWRATRSDAPVFARRAAAMHGGQLAGVRVSLRGAALENGLMTAELPLIATMPASAVRA
jgi:hypothetical protein